MSRGAFDPAAIQAALTGKQREIRLAGLPPAYRTPAIFEYGAREASETPWLARSQREHVVPVAAPTDRDALVGREVT